MGVRMKLIFAIPALAIAACCLTSAPLTAQTESPRVVRLGLLSGSAKGDASPVPPGPINDVVAGTGLAGRGTTPTVTLSIANGGVGTAQLAAQAVTGANVAIPMAVSGSVASNGVLQVTNTNPTSIGILAKGTARAAGGRQRCSVRRDRD